MWTEQKVRRFWDYCVTNKVLSQISFARLNGNAIVKLALPYLSKKGKHLDYGCGGGYLMECLFRKGIRCQGIDMSPVSNTTTLERLSGYDLFDGIINYDGLPNKQISDNTYDAVFFVEVIEHLLTEKREAVLQELNRIVKEQGYILVSTPNNEDLTRQTVMCPDCGAIFHDTQHTTQYTQESLQELMSTMGFDAVLCKPTNLTKYRNLYLRIRYLLSAISARLRSAPAPLPHLIYLGRKRSNAYC
jgi:SAM-dependent methyltransferase